jgi:hypothetical protein
MYLVDDDVFVITAEVKGCPGVEIPLSELFDLATYTIVDNYLQVLHGYVIEILEDTAWMDIQSFSSLLLAGYDVHHPNGTGEVLALQKPALQQLILQNLRHCNDHDKRFALPLLIKFLMSDSDLPRRPVPRCGARRITAANSRNLPRAIPGQVTPRVTTSNIAASITHHWSRPKQHFPDQCTPCPCVGIQVQMAREHVDTSLLVTINGTYSTDSGNPVTARTHISQQASCHRILAATIDSKDDTGEVFVPIDNGLICEVVLKDDKGNMILDVTFDALAHAHGSANRITNATASHGLFVFAHACFAGESTAKVLNLQDDPHDARDYHTRDDSDFGDKDSTTECVDATPESDKADKCANINDCCKGLITGIITDENRNPHLAVPSSLKCFHVGTPCSLCNTHGQYAVVPTEGIVPTTTTARKVQFDFNILRRSANRIRTETVCACSTVTNTSYGFHLHTGSDNGMHRQPFPSLLTRYRPIDRGR